MTHLKNFAGAGALLLGSVFSAAADDLVVTRACAEEALKSTLLFGQAIEIMNDENGVGALTHYNSIDIIGQEHEGFVSGIISLNSANTVLGINASVTDNDKTAQANLKLDQEKPQIILTYDGEIINADPDILSDTIPSVAIAVVNKLDEKLRECAKPQFLSMKISQPSFKLG